MYFCINPSLLSNTVSSLKYFVDTRSSYISIDADDITSTIIITAGGPCGTGRHVINTSVTVPGSMVLDYNLFLKLIRTYTGKGVLYIRESLCKTKILLSQDSTFPKTSTLTLPKISMVLSITTFMPGVPGIKISPSNLTYLTHSIRSLRAEGVLPRNIMSTVHVEANSKGILEFSMMSVRGIVTGRFPYVDEQYAVMKMNNNIDVELLSNLPTTDTDIHITDVGNRIQFSSSGWTVVAPTIQVIFPSVANMFSNPTGSITIPTKDLLPVLRRASVINDSQQNNKIIVFDICNDQIEISVNSQRGEYTDTIMCISENISGQVSLIIDDLLSAAIAVSADNVKLEWYPGAIMVCSDNPDKDSVEMECIIRPVTVQVLQPVANMAAQQASIGGDVDGEEVNTSENDTTEVEEEGI